MKIKKRYTAEELKEEAAFRIEAQRCRIIAAKDLQMLEEDFWAFHILTRVFKNMGLIDETTWKDLDFSGYEAYIKNEKKLKEAAA